MVGSNVAVNILHWNCRFLQRRLLELHFMLEEYNIKIAALCETRPDDNCHPILTNYELISKDRDRREGGVALLVDRSFRVILIQDEYIDQLCIPNETELLFCKIWIGLNIHIYVCSVYSPPRGSNHRATELRAWHEILQFCAMFDPMVLCRDINGKSPLWSSQLQWSNVEGGKLESAIINSNLL